MKIELYGNRELLNIGKLELHTGEVHIWKLRWRELETFWNRHKPILEKEECQKAEHYRFHEDKMRYLAGKIAGSKNERQSNCLSDPATGQGRKDYGKAVS